MSRGNFSFEELPNIVYQLSEQISRLTEILEVQQPVENTNDLIPRKEACEQLGITVVTCWTWAKQGKLKTYKIGNKVYLRRSELEEVINQNITKK